MGGADDPAHASESNSSGGDTIHVRCSNGSKFSVKIGLDSTIRDFKAVLSQNCDIPADHQRLIYKGRILKDDQTLESYGTSFEFTSFYPIRYYVGVFIYALIKMDIIKF